MLEKQRYTVVSFQTTTQAMAVEKSLMADGVEGRIIPLPPEIDAGCGLAFASRTNTISFFEQYFAAHQLKYDAVTEIIF